MAIRLWPQDYERKDHITKAEKGILRYAARNFQNGHMVVGIDPVGLSSEKVKMGMYISPNEALVTFSIYSGKIHAMPVFSYIAYVQMVESKIYERLLDSKLLIVRNGEKKALKFPYKHIVMFPDEVVGKTTVSKDDLQQLRDYATFDSFRPIASDGKEKRIEDLKIFAGIRKAYDKTFKSLSELECRAIFERLAPEYTVVMNETINVRIAERKTLVTEADLRITGKELEYKTFFLDEYQVDIVNDMGKGHRVILANPGAGKSVLLLSKAFKYASLYKGSNVLLTCYNSNLADSYNFKRSCAIFGKDSKLFIMTFHKLVKKIYEECLHFHCASNIATEEEIQKCIDLVKQGKVKLRFKAIFIDEVQIFDPLYLELCYRLLEDGDDRVFLMAGDLNQAVRALSRKGDAPWKRMNGIQLDFTGRVRYIEKNYRNSQEIGEYISHMLQHMNTRLSMLDLINSLEYEYNSFKVGTNPTIALKVRTGVQRTSIKTSVIAAIKEIATTYKISYSDIAVLFPFRKVPYLNYHFLYWLQQGLDEEGISYSMIINEKNGFFVKKKPGDITGVVISTIESSLGLDFKAVILAGLFPYNYVNLNGQVGSEIKTWSAIKNMPEEQQTAVQSQMRAVYTACSRARDVLCVISDLKSGTPMEEIIKKVPDRTPLPQSPTQSGTPSTGVRAGNKLNTVTKSTASATIKERLGTFDAHYESFLSYYAKELVPEAQRKLIRFVGATATISMYESHIWHLYHMDGRRFPCEYPSAEAGEDFYSYTDNNDITRILIGYAPYGRSITDGMWESVYIMRLVVYRMIQFLDESYEKLCAVGFSGSIDEYRDMLYDYWIELVYNNRKQDAMELENAFQNQANNYLEAKGVPKYVIEQMTSDVDFQTVRKTLFDIQANRKNFESTNLLLATSTISHGVDEDSFNVMYFFGMPNNNAEYIQAYSRTGRKFTGIVVDIIRLMRVRDRSYLKNFVIFHQNRDDLVEAVPINRWAKNAIYSTLPGLLAGLIRQYYTIKTNSDSLHNAIKVQKLLRSGEIDIDDAVSKLIAAYGCNEQEKMSLAYKEIITEEAVNILSGIKNGNFTKELSLSDAIGKFSHGKKMPMTSLRDTEEQIDIKI